MTEAEDREALGARLKQAREYRGFSQEEVAKFLGVPRSAVSLFESGSRKIDALELAKLARLYERDERELVGRPQEPDSDDSVRLVARAAKDLAPEDREQVLRFAEYLRDRRRLEEDA